MYDTALPHSASFDIRQQKVDQILPEEEHSRCYFNETICRNKEVTLSIENCQSALIFPFWFLFSDLSEVFQIFLVSTKSIVSVSEGKANTYCMSCRVLSVVAPEFWTTILREVQ